MSRVEKFIEESVTDGVTGLGSISGRLGALNVFGPNEEFLGHFPDLQSARHALKQLQLAASDHGAPHG